MVYPSLIPLCLAAAAFVALPVASVFSAPADKAPATAQVSPALREFERTLNGLSADAKKLMDGPKAGEAFKPGDMVTLVEKVCAVPVNDLPEDLTRAFQGFSKRMKEIALLFAELPAEIPGTGIKEWMAGLAKSDPAAAKRFREFPKKMEAMDDTGTLASYRLETAALRHGIDLGEFLDPDSVGRDRLRPEPGKTTPEEFAAALRSIPGKRAKLATELQKAPKTMGPLAKYVRGEAALLFAIPLDGLPEELGARFAEHRHQVEKQSWTVEEYPADLPMDSDAVQDYINKRSQTEPGFVNEIDSIANRIQKRQQKRNESLAKFMEQAKAAGLDTGTFVPLVKSAGRVSPGK